MTEFNVHQLCWFGLGWAAELPGFSHGTNVPFAYAGPGRWELLPQPGSLSLSGNPLSGSVMTEDWVWSPGWHCHSFYPSSMSIMPKWAVKVPALAMLVMGWASSGELKGFCCTHFLFVQVQCGETQRNFSHQSCPVFHSPQSCIWRYKIWIFVPCETQGNQLLLLAEVYVLAVRLF